MIYVNCYHLKNEEHCLGYFGFPTDNGKFTEKQKKKKNNMFCNLCPKKMNHQGNTTNMMVHLQYYQRSEYLTMKEKGKVKGMQLSQIFSLTTSNRQPSITEASNGTTVKTF